MVNTVLFSPLRMRIVLLLSILFLLLSCREPIHEKPISTFQKSGFFIINEGPFQTGTGSIDFYDREKDSIFHHIFQTKNNFPLGNIVQSAYSIDNQYLYIVVNNADKIEIVHQDNFESINTIQNIHFPRYITSDLNKLYISAWDNTIKVYKLNDSIHPTLIKSISTNIGPEKMLVLNHRLYVLNQGGFDIDSTITVIDTQTDTYIATIPVFPKPTGIVRDSQNRLWVMCSGKGWNGISQEDDSQGHLICIDPLSFEKYFDFTFPNKTIHPINLSYNKYNNCLYFSYQNGIYQKDIELDTLELTVICKNRNAHSILFDEKYKELLVSDPLDYSKASKIFRMNHNGMIIDSMRSGIISGNFLINIVE